MSRLLPRYTQPPEQTNPIDQLIANLQTREANARHRIANGHTPQASPEDLRGIPCIARGVGGTSPGTNPLTAALRAASNPSLTTN